MEIIITQLLLEGYFIDFHPEAGQVMISLKKKKAGKKIEMTQVLPFDHLEKDLENVLVFMHGRLKGEL